MVMNNLLHSNQLEEKCSPKAHSELVSWRNQNRRTYSRIRLPISSPALYLSLFGGFSQSELHDCGNGGDPERSCSGSSCIQEGFHWNSPKYRFSHRPILSPDCRATSWFGHILSHAYFLWKESHVLCLWEQYVLTGESQQCNACQSHVLFWGEWPYTVSPAECLKRSRLYLNQRGRLCRRKRYLRRN